jgi:hypothetical protein
MLTPVVGISNGNHSIGSTMCHCEPKYVHVHMS